MTRRVMVVGGAGFLGSHLVDRLLADGEQVEVLDDLSTGSLANLADARAAGAGLKIHHLGVGSPEAHSLLGMRQPEVVYHLAGPPPEDAEPGAWADSLRGTIALIDAARRHAIAKIVAVVPASVLYGQPPARQLPLKEADIVPRGRRGVLARATIDLLELGRQRDGIEFTVLAMSTVYGPRQRPDRGVVAALADAARHGRQPTITGDGRQTRDLLFVDDAVDALARAAAKGGGLVVNVGSGVQTPIRELWSAISGGQPEPLLAPARLDELPRFAVSCVRARIHLGWSSWTSLADGLATL